MFHATSKQKLHFVIALSGVAVSALFCVLALRSPLSANAEGSGDTVPGYQVPSGYAPVYNIPGYTAPGYFPFENNTPKDDAPGYMTPGYVVPWDKKPGYLIPGYTMPGYVSLGYQNPGYMKSWVQTPGYSVPGYTTPGYFPMQTTPGYKKFSNNSGSDAVQSNKDVGTKSTASLLIHDPLQYEKLIADFGLKSDPGAFATQKALVHADAKEFGIVMTDEQIRAAANFIVYGASRETIAIGAGERHALIRDYFQTIGRADVNWSDVQRLATGQKPVTRNLAKEQSQAEKVLLDFKLMTGHAPDFKNSTDDLAWNTMMYRIRDTRDLSAEQQGIQKFGTIYHRGPSTPSDWSIVRALGYALK